MKQKLFPALALGLLFSLSACTDEETIATTSGDYATMTFTLETSETVSTRAYSDGLTATYLLYGVYDSETNELLEDISQTTAVSAFTNKKATVELILPKGSSYNIVFWAQAEDAPYTISLSDKTVTLNANEDSSDDEDTDDSDEDTDDALYVDGNNESMDAFYALVETGTVTGNASQSVTLTRPFAQINIGTDDLEAYEAAGYSLEYVKLSVEGAGNTFNLLTEDVTFDDSTEGGTVVYDWTAIPTDEDFPYEKDSSDKEETDDEGNVLTPTTGKSDTYTYLSMNYIFVVGESSTVDVEFYYSANEEEEDDHNVSVTNVPVKRNYRTNLYGSLLTGTFTYDLEIDEDYEGEYNDPVGVNDSDELWAALEEGYSTVVFNDDITAETYTTAVYDDVTIDLNGYTLTLGDVAASRLQVEEDGVEVTITNGTIESSIYAVVVNAEDASVTLDNVEVTSTSYAIYATANADNTTITVIGSEISSTSSYAVYLYSGADDVTFEASNSTITSEASTGRAITSSAANATITLEDVTLESNYLGVYATGASTEISVTGGSVDAYYGIYTTGASTEITLDGTTIDADYLGVYATGSGTTLTATDVTVGATTHSAYFVYAGNATTTITGGSVEEAACYGVCAWSDNNTVKVSGTKFTDCGYYAITMFGSNSNLTVDDCTITTTSSDLDYGWGICIGQSTGTTSQNTAAITNTTIDVSESSIGIGVKVLGYENEVTIEDCTITHSYFGITQDGTSTPGSTITVKSTTIYGPYAGIYLSMSTSSEYYNTLTVSDNCTITATDASAIEVKKTYLTVSSSTLVSGYGSQQDYSLYGSGASGDGYGIVLAGYTAGRSYFADFESTDGVVNLTDVTYTLAASTDKDGSTPPWYVLYYQGYTTEGYSNTESSCNYTSLGDSYSDGATSSSSYNNASASSSLRRQTPSKQLELPALQPIPTIKI